MVLSLMASVAEFESLRISERTREALASAKVRGVQLVSLRPNTITLNDQAKAKATAAGWPLPWPRPKLSGQKRSSTEALWSLRKNHLNGRAFPSWS